MGSLSKLVERESVRTTVSFLALLLTVEMVASAVEPALETTRWGSPAADEKVRQVDALDAGAVDVVFLGSSVVAAGVDPVRFIERSEWAETAYNAALPGAAASLTHDWAVEVVLEPLMPRVVVIGLTPRAVNRHGVNQQEALRSYRESVARLDRISEDWYDVAAELRRLSAFARIGPMLRRPVTLLRGFGSAGDNPISPLGFHGIHLDGTLEIDDYYRSVLATRVLNDFSIGDGEVNALVDTIHSAEATDAEVYLAAFPIHESTIASLGLAGADILSEYDRWLSAFVRDHDVELIDLTGVVPDPSGYSDAFHVNAIGSELITAVLAERIRAPSA